MIAFIGLGNVGEKFRDTKHNAGFYVVDEMANRHNILFKPAKGGYVIASKPDKFFSIELDLLVCAFTKSEMERLNIKLNKKNKKRTLRRYISYS